MNKENMDKIVEDFPEMFYDIQRGPQNFNPYRVISCGDGWFDIVYNLCKEIHPMRAKVMQIKEKFGGLRFHCSFPKDYSERGYVFIRKAEEEAFETCEKCGDLGEFRIRNGWRMVSCQKCHIIYCEEHPEEQYP